MLSVQEAEGIILDLVESITDREKVSLADGIGRTLAQSVTSKLDFPYWDNSAMDGYAVKFSDVEKCSAENPVKLEIVAEIQAGCSPQIELQSGQAARIFTGAMLPPGADTIVMQEQTNKVGKIVTILASPQPHECVRHKGSYYRAGDALLNPGIKLNPPEMAILATAQCTEVSVFRRPKVAILSTGDELITPDKTLKPGQIIDSNQYLLTSFVQQNGAIPLNMGIIRDRKADLKASIAEAINQADFVLSTGGVSVGEYDYVDAVLTELGGDIRIRSVAIKPGKPLTVAKFNHGCVYFGIPGNPVSTMVTCWRFIQPALKKLSGLANHYLPTFVEGKTLSDLSSGGSRETYLWGKLFLVRGKFEFELAAGSHSSGNLINLAQTNALAAIPVGEKFIPRGSSIRILTLPQSEAICR